MQRSTDRILTTHVGSLPRTQAVTDVLFARAAGRPDEPGADGTIANAVKAVVKRQVDVGIDIVSDGEMSKISYATYVSERLSGFDGDTPREPGQDLVEFPGLLKKLAERGATAKYRRPRCVGPVRVKDTRPVATDLENLKSAAAAASAREAFMNAASPGVVALFQPNDFYSTQDGYLEALAEALRSEYEAIVAAGIVLQIDAPDLGMGRHTMYRDRTEDEFTVLAAKHIEVLNHALRNVPADRVRMHVCWGNYEGPHHHDIPLARLLPVVLRAKPQALLFEAANPRHAHEWAVFGDVKLPEEKVLIPGVISSTTNYVEHPLLVAERLERLADLVGRERVIGGSDCGYGTFAGFGPVEPDIAYMKLAALVEGARIASGRLWRSRAGAR
ncbi:MAG TPA: cobalamin-independent methionine synthase II family protein [Steroidobacteraceae bacterium]|nr:cobalamin-independent methionine synthase II family protein [Steroidobacteraceae bacterium]